MEVELISLIPSMENLLGDASQQLVPPLSSGRLVSQQKLPGLHSRTASFPAAVLPARRQLGIFKNPLYVP